MDFRLTPEETEFQQEVRAFLKKEMTEGAIEEHHAGQGLGPYSRELLRKMGENKLLAPSWPKEYGGLELSPVTRFILSEEMAYHYAPYPLSCLEVSGPAIKHYGTEEQKQKYLPMIANGEVEFATGYTEPNSGSDVASLALRAVEKDDKYIINGQKLYNTHAHYAEYIWLATRTDPSAPKHKGITLFIVDLKNTPGITIRPLQTMAGVRTNEIFFDNVEVPKENMVGEKNRGWEYMVGALNYERGGTVGDLQRPFDDLVEYVAGAKQAGIINDEDGWLSEQLVRLKTELHIGRLLIYKIAYIQDKGLPLTYEASLGKLYSSQVREHLFSVAMEMLGLYGQLCDWSKWVKLSTKMKSMFLDSPRWNIVAGTSEIQRNIIAIRGLHLPTK